LVIENETDCSSSYLLPGVISVAQAERVLPLASQTDGLMPFVKFGGSLTCVMEMKKV
jgi:hypothetical protein